MFTKNTGFTLLEIIVASSILFSSIAILALIYKTSYKASETSSAHVMLPGIMKPILLRIQDNIRDGGNSEVSQLNSSGTVWGIEYQWKAEVVQDLAPPDKFDMTTGNIESYETRYKLWNVELIVGKSEKKYIYKELSWY